MIGKRGQGICRKDARAARLGLLTTVLVVLTLQRGASAQDAQSPYRPVRYDDNFTYLHDPTKRDDFWDPVKYIQLGDPDTYVTLGGELRERLDDYSEPLFGLVRRRDHLTDILQRALLNADLHLGTHVRVFLQLGNYVVAGKRDLTGPADQDRLALQQAFLDMTFPAGSGTFTVRIGRQEMAFGTQRLVSVREPLNIRRSFDGVDAIYQVDDARVDAFVTRPVKNQIGPFGDEPDPGQSFWGVYATSLVRALPGLHADVYYLGLEHNRAPFVSGVADEVRHTVGTRLWGEIASWDYNTEITGQTGRFGQQTIAAWAVSTDTGYTFAHMPLSPRLGLIANIASGNHNPKAGDFGTFNPLFPAYGYFTEAELVLESNLIDVHPSITIHPRPGLSLSASVDFLWRESLGDGFYQAPVVPLIRDPSGTGRYIGTETQLFVNWQVDRHVNVVAAYVHFAAGPTITSVGGRSVDFLGARIGYQF